MSALPETETVLVVHSSTRVRGAIHRSLSSVDGFSIALAANIAEAKTMFAECDPGVLLLRIVDENVQWAKELKLTGLGIVFCYNSSDHASLTAAARLAGMQHFIELPGDDPESWARQAPRLQSTLLRAVGEHKSRKATFGKATQVMAAMPASLELSRAKSNSDVDTNLGSAKAARFRRATVVQGAADKDLDKAREDER